MLSINGRTITRNIEKTLHQHEHTAPLLDYYRSRFQWSQTTINTVDWESYASAYKPFSRTRTFFTKNGWKQLPVGRRLHRWASGYDHRCPSCSLDFESDDHIYQCLHIQRQQWRHDVHREIRDAFGAILDPDLLSIAQIGMTSYFNNNPPNFSDRFPHNTSNKKLNVLIDQQTAIGWDHFMRGKLSKEWGPAQYRYARRYNLIDASKNWQVRLNRMLANASFKAWQTRNGCRHGIDSATKQQASQEQAHRELHCLYSFQHMVLPQDTALFRTSIETHLQESTSQIRTWIIHNKKLITHSVQIAKAQERLHIKRIQSFFPVIGKTTSIVDRRRTITSAPRQQRYTRITKHFSATHKKRSSKANNQKKEKLRQFNTPTMTTYYNPGGSIQLRMPTITENEPITSTSPQRRMTRRRHLQDRALFPDHPG